MSGMYEGAIQDLIDALGRLPGIGPKSAQRIAFHILQSDPEVASALVDSTDNIASVIVNIFDVLI
jgi:recombination protein RecR